MAEVLIRKAAIEDLELLRQFEQGVISYERAFDSTLADDPISYYDIKAMLFADEVELVVAVSNGNVVGSGYARIEQPKPYLKHKVYAYLGFMYVLPEHRGQGINKKILEALKAWCLARNINEIRLDVYARNKSAIKAYEKAEFVPHLLNMRME